MEGVEFDIFGRYYFNWVVWLRLFAAVAGEVADTATSLWYLQVRLNRDVHYSICIWIFVSTEWWIGIITDLANSYLIKISAIFCFRTHVFRFVFFFQFLDLYLSQRVVLLWFTRLMIKKLRMHLFLLVQIPHTKILIWEQHLFDIFLFFLGIFLHIWFLLAVVLRKNVFVPNEIWLCFTIKLELFLIVLEHPSTHAFHHDIMWLVSLLLHLDRFLVCVDVERHLILQIGMRVLMRLQKSEGSVDLVVLLILLQLAGSRLDNQRVFLAITSLWVVALHTAELELLMLHCAFILL